MTTEPQTVASRLTRLKRRFRALHSFILPRMSAAYHAGRAQLQVERSALMVWYSPIFCGFYGLDMIQYPQHWRVFGGLRLAVVLTMLVLLVLQRSWTGLRLYSGAAFYSLACLVVTSMCIYAEGFGSIYVVGIIICLLAGGTVEVMRPLGYAGLTCGVVALYIGGNLLLDHDRTTAEMASGIFFLLSAAFVCIIATIVSERQRRLLFLAQEATQEKNLALSHTLRQQSEFFSKMTHELRTPLHSIKGFVELIEESSRMDAPGQRRLALINNSADRLLRVVTDILDLAKHEAVGLRVSPSQIAVGPLLEDLVLVGRSLVGQREVSVDMDLDPGDAPAGQISLYADEVRLRQVLLNLLMNAVKFTQEGQVRIRCVARGDRVEFAVVDSGVGIPKAEQSRLFTAFRQSRPDHQRIGTGLGLNIASQFTTLLAGTLSFVSEEGRGSTFTVSIPSKYERGADL